MITLENPANSGRIIALDWYVFHVLDTANGAEPFISVARDTGTSASTEVSDTFQPHMVDAPASIAKIYQDSVASSTWTKGFVETIIAQYSSVNKVFSTPLLLDEDQSLYFWVQDDDVGVGYGLEWREAIKE